MNQENAKIVYADIIDLPHRQSTRRKHMPLYDRAAQFASYKALSGYEDMVAEESRLTDRQLELSENEIDLINRVIVTIIDRLEAGDHPAVSVTFFKPDKYKHGGSYETLTGVVKKADLIGKALVFYGSDNIEDKRVPTIEIPIDRIIGISLHP